MYRSEVIRQTSMELPFNVPLNTESRWVRLAEMLPWERIAVEYVRHFRGYKRQAAKSIRLAFGALYIQATEGFTDEQTKLHIQENPHMQYFCGYSRYSPEPPFDTAMMVHFRKRISAGMIQRITHEVFAMEALSQMDASAMAEPEKWDSISTREDNRGTLVLDATCRTQDIEYPSDIGIMNQSREITEEIIDVLYEAVLEKYAYKPRTYRNVARKDYMEYIQIAEPTAAMTRKYLRKQLQYTARNLRIIEDLIMCKGSSLELLSGSRYRELLVVQEVYRQQKEMYDMQVSSCDARIVSISEPHVRPIESVPTEFGTKAAMALVGGYAFIIYLPWENIPETTVLPDAAEKYRRIFGFYPKNITGGRTCSNVENQKYCDKRGIHLCGSGLGWRTIEKNADTLKHIQEFSGKKNPSAGAIDTAEQKYGLDHIMAKLPDTSYTAVSMGVFAANMERKLRLLLYPEIYCLVGYSFEAMRLYIRHFLS